MKKTAPNYYEFHSPRTSVILLVGRWIFGSLAIGGFAVGLAGGCLQEGIRAGVGLGLALGAVPAVIFGLTYVRRVF